ILQQRPALGDDQLDNISTRRLLTATDVDLPLRGDRSRLVRWKRVDGKEPRRMAREPIERHHPDPRVLGRQTGRLRRQLAAERADLGERLRVIEGQEIPWLVAG